MAKLTKDSGLMNGKGESGGKWVTVKGTHIYIEDGQSIEDAMKAKLEKTSQSIDGNDKKVYNDNKRGHVDLLTIGNDHVQYIAQELGVSESDAFNYADTIKAYTGSWYTEIRSYQSGKSFGDFHPVTKLAKCIEEYISKAPKWDKGETFRGITVSQGEFDSMTIGSIIDCKGTSSWTSAESVALDFADNRKEGERTIKVVLHSQTQTKGTSVRHLSDYISEDEVLVSKDSRYKISSIDEKDGIKHVYLEEE